MRGCETTPWNFAPAKLSHNTANMRPMAVQLLWDMSVTLCLFTCIFCVENTCESSPATCSSACVLIDLPRWFCESTILMKWHEKNFNLEWLVTVCVDVHVNCTPCGILVIWHGTHCWFKTSYPLAQEGNLSYGNALYMFPLTSSHLAWYFVRYSAFLTCACGTAPHCVHVPKGTIALNLFF